MLRVSAELRGRVAAITGASAGIGKACAERFAAEGMAVALGARRGDRLTQIADAIRAAGGQALPVVMDVTREADAERLVEKTIETYGRLDVLVCNAGIGYYGTIEETGEDVKIDWHGHMDRGLGVMNAIAAIEAGFPQKEIANSAYHYQKQIETGEKIIVGVNKYVQEEDIPIELLEIDPEIEKTQAASLASVKAGRNQKEVESALARLEKAARSTENTMPFIIDCVRAYTSEQEICDVFRKVWGIYRDPGYF